MLWQTDTSELHYLVQIWLSYPVSVRNRRGIGTQGGPLPGPGRHHGSNSLGLIFNPPPQKKTKNKDESMGGWSFCYNFRSSVKQAGWICAAAAAWTTDHSEAYIQCRDEDVNNWLNSRAINQCHKHDDFYCTVPPTKGVHVKVTAWLLTK